MDEPVYRTFWHGRPVTKDPDESAEAFFKRKQKSIAEGKRIADEIGFEHLYLAIQKSGFFGQRADEIFYSPFETVCHFCNLADVAR